MIDIMETMPLGQYANSKIERKMETKEKKKLTGAMLGQYAASEVAFAQSGLGLR